MAWSRHDRPMKVGIGLTHRGVNMTEFTVAFALIMKNLGVNGEILSNRGFRIDYARNDIVEDALDAGCSHVFFLDDDVFPFAWDPQKRRMGGFLANVVERLMQWEYPIAVGLYWTKQNHWNVAAIDRKSKKLMHLGGPIENVAGRLAFWDTCATGLALIDTRVFGKVDYPWFNYTRRGGRGEKKEDLSEDYAFFARCTEAGFSVLTDGMVVGQHAWPDFHVDGTRDLERLVMVDPMGEDTTR